MQTSHVRANITQREGREIQEHSTKKMTFILRLVGFVIMTVKQ